MNNLTQSALGKLTVLVLTFAISTPLMAGMITTDEMMRQVETSIHRDSVSAALEREDVQQVLISKGVDIKDAQARVAAMTDAEIAMIHQQVDKLPAGAGAGSTVVTILLVLVFLDILGVTNIFTFINPIR